MIGGSWRRAWRGLALAGGAAVVLSGCELLYPGFYGVDEDWSLGRVSTYEVGSARLTLRGGTVEERQLPMSSGSYTDGFGSEVVFRDDEGWALTLLVYADDPMPYLGAGTGTLTIHRAIRGHWAASDWDASCRIDVTRSDEEALAGSAKCIGMRWMDQIAGSGFAAAGLPLIEGEGSFDVEIAFEAHAPTPDASPGASGRGRVLVDAAARPGVVGHQRG